MSYNNEHAGRVVFDVETAPLEDAADYLEEPTAPSNYVKPEAIANYIAKAKAEQLDKCSLDVDLCRVVAIGWWRECDSEPRVVHEGTATNEAVMLRAFWNHAEDCHCVGFSCLDFDLPVLLRRSLYLGVDFPLLQIDKYRHPRVSDVMAELSYNGKLKWRSLDFYCRRFGIKAADDVSGADIGALVKAGDWAKVEAHCRVDVLKTAALAERLGLFRRASEAVI